MRLFGRTLISVLIVLLVLFVFSVVGCESPTAADTSSEDTGGSDDPGDSDDSGDSTNDDSTSGWIVSSAQPTFDSYDDLNGFEVGVDGVITIMYENDGDYGIEVEQWDGSSWTVIATGLGSGDYSTGGVLTLDQTGAPVIATPNNSTDRLPVVERWNGSSWDDVDSSGLQSAVSALNLSSAFWGYADIEIDADGNIFVAVSVDFSTTVDDKIGVWKYDGSAWSYLGATPDPSASGPSSDGSFDIETDDVGDLYVAYSINGSYDLGRVDKWSTDQFVQLGTDFGTYSNRTSIRFDSSGTPFVLIRQSPNIPDGDYTTESVSLFSYVSGSWTEVGSAVATSSSGDLNTTQSAVAPNGDDLIVAYADPVDNNSISFRKFDGLSDYVAAAPDLELGTDNYGSLFLADDLFLRCVGNSCYVAYTAEVYMGDWEFHVAEYDLTP